MFTTVLIICYVWSVASLCSVFVEDGGLSSWPDAIHWSLVLMLSLGFALAKCIKNATQAISKVNQSITCCPQLLWIARFIHWVTVVLEDENVKITITIKKKEWYKTKADRKLTPLTPFFSLSSTKSDKYSGDFGLRLMKYSKSPEIICLNNLSSLNDSWRKCPKRSLRSRRFWNTDWASYWWLNND